MRKRTTFIIVGSICIALLCYVTIAIPRLRPSRQTASHYVAVHVYWSGWEVSIDHWWMYETPVDVFVETNQALQLSILEDVGGNVAACYVVPAISGYEVVALSHHPLTDDQHEQINHQVDQAIQRAREQIKSRSDHP